MEKMQYVSGGSVLLPWLRDKVASALYATLLCTPSLPQQGAFTAILVDAIHIPRPTEHRMLACFRCVVVCFSTPRLNMLFLPSQGSFSFPKLPSPRLLCLQQMFSLLPPLSSKTLFTGRDIYGPSAEHRSVASRAPACTTSRPPNIGYGTGLPTRA